MKKEPIGNKKELTYSREALLKSKRFSYVQKDFLSAILNKDFYTMQEAEDEINKFFGGGK